MYCIGPLNSNGAARFMTGQWPFIKSPRGKIESEVDNGENCGMSGPLPIEIAIPRRQPERGNMKFIIIFGVFLFLFSVRAVRV